ncbi:MAG: 4-aminobutyrate--2-oxoglutarate transaminase [Candidatus Woesearchaeota archaeon]|nr:4-aminobutyrate--2-oxoglutarate transaminase [Candidatus Woesearchaeota archaeon]
MKKMVKVVSRPQHEHSLQDDLLKRKEQHVARGFHARHPLFILEGHNSFLKDVDGKVYIDFTSGIGATNAGHSNPAVVDAIKRQLDHITHISFSTSYYQSYVDVCEKLNGLVPIRGQAKSALFTSGAEAVENAIKIAKVATGRKAVVSFEHGFHGRTLMTMTLSAMIKPYKKGFGPFAPEVYKLPHPYQYRMPKNMTEESYVKQLLEDIEEQFFVDVVDPDDVACLIMEPITGEGGFLVPPVSYIQKLRKLCQKHGILFVADEIQTGFCRTGKMFATEHFDIKPDLITMGKSLSNGMPLSAVSGRAEIMDAVSEGGLGGTFAGHPASCAAALAAIDYYECYKLWERAEHIGNVIRKKMHAWKEQFTSVGDVRGLGAMNAIELVKDRRLKTPDEHLTTKIIDQARLSGLLLLKSGIYENVVRTLPPLTIEDSTLHEGLEIFEKTLQHLH